MAETCTVLHAENKRSLPAWMLKSCSDNQVSKTEDQNAKASESDEQTRNLDQTKSVKRNSGRQLKQVDLVGAGEGTGELGVLRRCEGRAKARKASKIVVQDEVEEVEEVDTGWRSGKVDSAGDGELGVMLQCTSREKARMTKNIYKDEVKQIEKVASKNLRKVSEGAAPKNRRKRKLENAKSEASSPERVDDEIELTIEDLLSIAKEYVNADEKKQHELENMKTARDCVDTSCHTIPISTECTTITRNTSPSEHGRDENSNHQELQYSSSFKMTGDVYQDMLNLFLCPVFSKPASHLKEPEPIESVETTIYHVPEKKDCPRELPRQVEPVAKKKSSLKDKVALFL